MEDRLVVPGSPPRRGVLPIAPGLSRGRSPSGRRRAPTVPFLLAAWILAALSVPGGVAPFAGAFLSGDAFPASRSGELHAQQPVPEERLRPTAELLRKPTAIEPRTGPPGTSVQVRGDHLPALTPVNLAFGGTGSGFEGLAFLLTDERGRLEATVEVPEWATRDELHRFIIFDAYFSPLSMTELFHVTDQGGSILRRGEVVESGPRCAVVAGADDGDRYALVDLDRELEAGARVEVEGVVVESTECGAETHLRVVSVRSARR